MLIAVLALGCEPIPEPPPPTDPVPPTDAEVLAQRPYELVIPPKFDPLQPQAQTWGLVIALHGYGGSGEQVSNSLGLARRAASSKGTFFYVAPNGLKDRTGARAWHPSSQHWPSWDVEYLRAILRDVSAKYPIDPRRVFVVGHSQGAHMAHRMACDVSELVVAIFSHAGQVTKQAVGCQPTNAVSVLQLHGTADEAIGYYGDVNVPGDPTVPSAHETIATWARNDKCTGALAPTGVTLDLDADVAGAETKVEAYEGCPPGVGVELWTMQDSMHGPTWAGDITTTIVDWLEAHPRR